jgi:type I restriction enzyme S subunit
LMTEGGDFDKLGRGDVWRGQIDSCLHQNHVFAVRPKKESVDSFFLSALAASEHGKNYFLSCAKRSTNLASINSSQLKNFPVLLPPLGEQRRIAQILSTWDQAIVTTKRLLANSRMQKQALADSLLAGKRRLAHRQKWISTKLNELIVESRVLGSGGDTARKITVKLYGRGVVGKAEKRIGSESTQYYRRSAGQFIYSKLDFLNGAFGLIPEHLDGYESTLDLPAFDFLRGVDPRWFLYLVSQEAFYLGHLGLANGGRKARRVNPSDLLRVNIQMPVLDEQKAIAELLDTAQAEVNNFSNQLSALRQQKFALMAQLLTGKRRVCLPEAEAEIAS